MKYLLLRTKRFCGYIAGFVFFIAGINKLLDPVGAGLVMKEYMDFLHLAFLSGIAKVSAALLAFAEVLIGTALITGVWRRITAVSALIFQSFFTILTVLLVIFNPEMDCGCFGEAIHLTHMETFVKNVFLLFLLLAFAFPSRHLGTPRKIKYVSFSLVSVSVLLFSVYSWRTIPLVDYTSFKPAVALQAGSTFGLAGEDRFEALFIYEKDGKVQEFTLEELPDSTWNFIETRTVEKEDDNTVSLSFYDEDGAYQDTLAVKGKVMIVSVYDVDVRPAALKKISEFVENATSAGFRTLVLTSDNEDVHNLDDVTYYSDYKTLITMNRSNGGVTYFSDGYLVKKWSSVNSLDQEELEGIYSGDDTETIIGSSSIGSLAFQGFLLFVIAIMLLL